MGIAEWFTFKSKAQREQEQKEYEQMMFPHGPGQREWELNTIAALLPKKKRDWQDYQFCLLILREDLYKTNLPQSDKHYMTLDRVMEKWYKNRLVQILNKGNALALIRATAFLENAAPNLESMPTVEEIIAKAEADE